MGMYTELIFQGETKANLPKEIEDLIYYFFDENSARLVDKYELPDHPFFKCERWSHIGHMGSYYFNPFSLRYMQNHIQEDGSKNIFLRCDLKNYDDEIKLFLDWINPYMNEYWGYYLYEEDDMPTFFKVSK